MIKYVQYRPDNKVVQRVTSLVILFFVLSLPTHAQGDNIPPKKEDLAAMIKRFESSGFAIGVYQTEDVLIQRKEESAFANNSIAKSEGMVDEKVLVSGQTKICECITDKASQLAADLNEKYGTSIFEVIDPSTIPSKTVLGQKIPDWWKSKYKGSVTMSVAPTFDATIVDKKIEVSLAGNTRLLFMEYSKKKDKPKQRIVATTGNNFLSSRLKTEEPYTKESANALKLTMESVKEIVAWPSEEELSAAFETSYEKAAGEFMDKLAKK